MSTPLSVWRSEFARDVAAGLRQPQRQLPAHYLYDDVGSALFEVITQLPEYGLTRAELRLLEQARIPDRYPQIAELGSGNSRKIRVLLQAMHCEVYYPIDCSSAALEQCSMLDGCRVSPVRAGFLEGIRLIPRRSAEPLLVLFLGSTIGNFDRASMPLFLQSVREQLRPGDALLAGFDLVKARDRMLRAYNDALGVTAAFNANVLCRMNRELGADFDLARFWHHAIYNDRHRRVEMHLECSTPHTVSIPGAGISCRFAAGETIWTESSHKFEPDEIETLARLSGFNVDRYWVDSEWPFSLTLWTA